MFSFVKPLVFLIWLISFSYFSKDTPDKRLGNRFLLQPVLYLYLVILTIKSSAKALTHRYCCCHLLFCWCCLAFTTDDAKSAEMAFCSLMDPPLPKCSLRTKSLPFLWIRCTNNTIMLHFSMKEAIPCFYPCFSWSYLLWISCLVSNILYWCWAVSQGLLVRFSSCSFIYLIRNFLPKKIIVTTHYPRPENYLQAIWNQHVDFKFSWGFPKWLFNHKYETLLLETVSPGRNALRKALPGLSTQHHLKFRPLWWNLKIGTPNFCHSLKESWYTSV